MPYFWRTSWHNSIFAVQGFVASFFYMLCFSISAAIKNQSNEPSPDWDCGFPGHGPLADRFNTSACSELKEGNAYGLFVTAFLFCGIGAAILHFNTAARCGSAFDCGALDAALSVPPRETSLTAKTAALPTGGGPGVGGRSDPSFRSPSNPTRAAAPVSTAPPSYGEYTGGSSAEGTGSTDDMFNADGSFK